MLEIIILIAGVLNLIMGVVVLFGEGDSQGKYSFALFSIVTFIWALCVFFIHRSDFTIFVTLSYSIASLFVMCLISWAYHFSLGVNKWNFRSFYIYILGIIFAVLPFINGLVVFNIHKDSSGVFISDNGPLYNLYTSFFIITYIFVLWSLIKLYKSSDYEKKSQA